MALPSLGLRSYWLIRKTMSQFVTDHRVPGVALHSKVSVVPFVFYMGRNSRPFSLSIQPLTAFAKLSYGKRDFATDFRPKASKRRNKRDIATRILIILSPKLRKQITSLYKTKSYKLLRKGERKTSQFVFDTKQICYWDCCRRIPFNR